LAAHVGLEPDIEIGGLGVHETAATQQLLSLPNYAAWVRTLIDDTPSPATRIDLMPPPLPVNLRPQRLLNNSRIRFGRDRSVVEKKIFRFLTEQHAPP